MRLRRAACISAEDYTADNIADENFGGGELCAVNEYLPDNTKQPAYKESPQKLQKYHPVSKPNGSKPPPSVFLFTVIISRGLKKIRFY